MPLTKLEVLAKANKAGGALTALGNTFMVIFSQPLGPPLQFSNLGSTLPIFKILDAPRGPDPFAVFKGVDAKQKNLFFQSCYLVLVPKKPKNLIISPLFTIDIRLYKMIFFREAFLCKTFFLN